MPNWDELARRISQAGSAAASAATGGASSSRGGAVEQEPLVFFRSGKTRQAIAYQKKTTAARGGRQLRDDEVAGRPSATFQPYRSGVLKPVKEPDEVKPLSQALGQFYQWSDQERAEWGRYLVSIGFINEEDADDYTTLLKAWQEVVQEGANFTAAGRKADPWQVAKMLAGTDNDPGNPGGGRTRAGRERGFTGSRSTSSQSVDLTDPETARALVRNVLTQQYGRDATDEEVQSFTSTLNSAERANPLTTTTTTNFVDGEATSQSQTTQGGLTASAKQQVVTDQAQSLPEYGAYQAASFYFPTFLQAMSSPV